MKTPSLIAAGLLAIVGVAGPAASQQNATWTEVIEPFHLMDNIWYVGTAGLSSYLVKTPDGDILLDVGVPGNAAVVERNLDKIGVKLSDIKILLNSHSHYDHSGGLARLKADTHAKLIASEGDKYALEKGVYPGSETNASLSFPPVVVDQTIADGGQVTLGGLTLTAHFTPGHTKGCTTWTWPVKDTDGSTHQVVFFCSATVAANRLAPNPQYPGIIEDYRATFQKVKTFDGDVFLAPHAEFYDMPGKKARLGQPGPNPFIQPGGFHAFAASLQTQFEAALVQQQAAAARAAAARGAASK